MIMTQAYYKEEQSYAPWILWLVGLTSILAVVGLVYALTLEHSGQGKPFGNDNSNLLWISLMCFFALLIANLNVFSSRLKLEIKDGQLKYRYVPLHFSFRTIKKEEIEFWQIRRISPLVESRGFGYKWGFNSISIVMKGNDVLTLKAKGKKKLNLGTQRPERLKNQMELLMNPEEY